MPNLKILCVEQFSDIGGGQRSLLDLLPEFQQRGWMATVALPDEGPLCAAVTALGCETEMLRSGSYSSMKKPPSEALRYAKDLPRLARAVDEVVRNRRIDLLYVNGPRFLPAASWVACRRRIPLLFHCHSRLLQRSAIVLAGVSLRLSRARAIACCAFAAEPLRRYASQGRIPVVYNGVGGVTPCAARPSGKIRRIGVVGRIEPEKGQKEFILSARRLVKTIPDCQFIVAGAPMFSGGEYYSQVVSLAQGLPVQFLGWQANLGKLFSGLDLLVVPSASHEATTRIIPEAYSAGLPVVAFPSGGIPEILKHNRTGFLAANNTPEALADCIENAIASAPDVLSSISRTAQMEWQRRYTLGKYRRRVCRFIAETAGQSV
jgi:glycosyltransferase involved in cell wall biosynthesis